MTKEGLSVKFCRVAASLLAPAHSRILKKYPVGIANKPSLHSGLGTLHQCAKGENKSSRNGLCIHAAGAGNSMELTLGQYTCDSRGRFAAV